MEDSSSAESLEKLLGLPDRNHTGNEIIILYLLAIGTLPCILCDVVLITFLSALRIPFLCLTNHAIYNCIISYCMLLDIQQEHFDFEDCIMQKANIHGW